MISGRSKVQLRLIAQADVVTDQVDTQLDNDRKMSVMEKIGRWQRNSHELAALVI